MIFLLVALITAPRVMTLDEALKIALVQQPKIRQAQAQAHAAEARVGSARAPLLPQVSGSASYQRSTSNFIPRPGSVPSQFTQTTSSFKTTGFYNFSITANQLIYDFGQAH